MPESNKTEQATPRKRQKARERGQVARSRDLMNSLAMITSVLVLASLAPAFAGQWRGLLHRTLDAAIAPGFANSMPLLSWTGFTVFRIVALTVGLSWLAAMMAALAQGGLVFAPAALQPELFPPESGGPPGTVVFLALHWAIAEIAGSRGLGRYG